MILTWLLGYLAVGAVIATAVILSDRDDAQRRMDRLPDPSFAALAMLLLWPKFLTAGLIGAWHAYRKSRDGRA